MPWGEWADYFKGLPQGLVGLLAELQRLLGEQPQSPAEGMRS